MINTYVLLLLLHIIITYVAPLLPCHACRWHFSCSDWLSSAQGASRVLPAQLQDPRQASTLMVQYQVRLAALHIVCV